MQKLYLQKIVCSGIIFLLFSLAASGLLKIETITLKEVLTVGSLDDDAIFQWVGVAADEGGMIYLTDSMDYSLKKFDPKGCLTKKQGRKGQGPGEFLAPRLLEYAGGFLYVTDQYLPGIQVFNESLDFRRRIPLSFPVGCFKVMGEDRFAVVTVAPDKCGRFLIVDSRGEVMEEIPYAAKAGNNSLMMDLVEFEVRNGQFYLAYVFQDRIEKRERNGDLVWSRSLLGKRKVKKKKISNFVLPTEVIYKDIALDSMERVYVLGGHFSKNRGRDIYVFSPSGEHLSTLTLPESSHTLYIDEQDFLYSRANEGVTLKKYAVVYKDQQPAFYQEKALTQVRLHSHSDGSE